MLNFYPLPTRMFIACRYAGIIWYDEWGAWDDFFRYKVFFDALFHLAFLIYLLIIGTLRYIVTFQETTIMIIKVSWKGNLR